MSFSNRHQVLPASRIMAVAVAIIGTVSAFLAGFNPQGSLDVYALVADGRAMWDGGFHFLYENPHSIAEAPITCQEWAHSAVMAPLAEWFGWNGIGLWAAIQATALFMAVSWMVSGFDCLKNMTREGRWTLSLLCGFVVLITAKPILSPRPIWLSAAFLCCEAKLVHDYMDIGGRWRYAAVVGLVIMESNFHASFVWLDFALIALFALTAGKPLLKALPFLLCLPAALVNPYGIEALVYLPMSTFLLHGMFIDELLPLADPSSGISRDGRFAGLAAAVFLLGALAYTVVRHKPDREQLSWAIISTVAVIAALSSARNAWLVLVLAGPAGLAMFAGGAQGVSLPKIADNTTFVALVMSAVLGMSVTSCAHGVRQMGTEDNFPITPSANELNFLEDDGSSIIVDQWLGGMVELYGLDVAIDTRPEIWASAYLPGSDTSFLQDYISMADVKTATPESMRDYIAKYKFKWVPVKEGSVACDAMDRYGLLMGYEVLEGTEDAPIWRLSESQSE